MSRFILLLSLLLPGLLAVRAQAIKLATWPLQAIRVTQAPARLRGQAVLRVTKDTAVHATDEATFARLQGIALRNGTIEVDMLSRLLPTAAPQDRGFIGVAFRVDEQNTRFGCFYLRPTNGRAPDQVRRNHTVQYFAYPDYRYERLRRESPAQYEVYADMALDEWQHLKIVVHGPQAQLYLNGAPQPVLLVTDLKLSDGPAGGIGLWVDQGTEGFFKDLVIRPE